MPRVSAICLYADCGKKVSTGIACDICDRWAHKNCTGLTDRTYSTLSEDKDLQWFCPDCKARAKDSWLSLPSSPSFQVTSPTVRHASPPTQSQASPSRSGNGKVQKAAATSAQKPTPKRHTVVSPASSKGQRCTSSGVSKRTSDRLSTFSTEEWRTVNRSKHRERKQVSTPVGNRNLEKLLRDLLIRVDDVGRLQRRYENNLGRSKNILIIAPESEIPDAKQRHSKERELALSVLRSTGLSPLPRWVRIHRVGRWNPSQPSQRPLLLGFKSTYERDQILAKAELVSSVLSNVMVKPDCHLSTKITPTEPVSEESHNGIVGTPRIDLTRLDSLDTSSPIKRTRSSSCPASPKNGGSQVVSPI